MMPFQFYYVQLKNGTSVFWKKISFSRKSVSKLKHWIFSLKPKIFTDRHIKNIPISQTEGYFENP